MYETIVILSNIMKNFKHKSHIVILGLLAIFLAGCSGKGGKEVLARIDQKDVITLKEFNERISNLPPRYQDIVSKNKKQFLDELIVDKLLYNEATSQNLERDPEVKRIFEEAKKKILIARLLKDEIDDKVTVSDEEIQDYYNANREKFTQPEVLRASHILVKTDKEANEILAELSGGRNFEDLARARSIDPTAKVGGDIGYFARGQLVPEIEEAAFDMKAGEISGVVKTQFGYHIVKLTERKKPRAQELSEVRDNIRQTLERIKKRQVFNDYVTDLKAKSKISINKELLESISKGEDSEKSPQE